MTTTQPLAGSSFTLGDRQNRALTIDAGNVKITSISVPEKHVTSVSYTHLTLPTIYSV